MKVGALSILQALVNGAIGIINDFIGTLNQIPGVQIGLVKEVTFATTAAAENAAAKQARASAYADAQRAMEANAAGRDTALAKMEQDAMNNHRWRQMGIDAERYLANNASNNGMDISGMAQDLGSIAGDTKKISANVADEDLKYLEDVAIRRYEANVNTTQLVPNITVQVNGESDKSVGVDIANTLKVMLAEQLASHTTATYAGV